MRYETLVWLGGFNLATLLVGILFYSLSDWHYRSPITTLRTLCITEKGVVSVLEERDIVDSEIFGRSEQICKVMKRQREFTQFPPSQCMTLYHQCQKPGE